MSHFLLLVCLQGWVGGGSWMNIKIRERSECWPHWFWFHLTTSTHLSFFIFVLLLIKRQCETESCIHLFTFQFLATARDGSRQSQEHRSPFRLLREWQGPRAWAISHPLPFQDVSAGRWLGSRRARAPTGTPIWNMNIPSGSAPLAPLDLKAGIVMLSKQPWLSVAEGNDNTYMISP